MSFHSRYDKGDWNALCDVCGRKYKASELTKRWDGLMCCSDDWEIRQPQDFVRGVADPLLTPWVRDEPSDTYIGYCTVWNSQGVANVATANCALAYGPVNSEGTSVANFAIASVAVANKVVFPPIQI